MFNDLGAQIAVEYDKLAPRCPQCGCKMRFECALGGVIVWTCRKCGCEIHETRKTFHARTR